MKTLGERSLMLGVDPSGNPIVLKLNADGAMSGLTEPVTVEDDYMGGQTLADQTGAGAVLTFTFASPVNLIVVDAKGAETDIARADPFGGVPAATVGIPCRDTVPTYMPVITTTVRIWAPTGMVVSVYGYRR